MDQLLAILRQFVDSVLHVVIAFILYFVMERMFLFRAIYMPKDAVPDTTGLSTSEKPVHPRTLAGQLLYPFRKR